MNVDLTYKRKKALIAAQVVGFVLGIFFMFLDEYETFWEVLGAVLAPVSCAAWIRFCVRAFQFGKVKLGVKVQDSNGDHIIIEKPGRGALAAAVAFFLPIGLITSLGDVSRALPTIVLIVLVVVGVFFCVLDIRYMVNYKQETKKQTPHEQG